MQAGRYVEYLSQTKCVEFTYTQNRPSSNFPFNFSQNNQGTKALVMPKDYAFPQEDTCFARTKKRRSAPVICPVGLVVVIQSILGLCWPGVRCWSTAKFLGSPGSLCFQNAQKQMDDPDGNYYLVHDIWPASLSPDGATANQLI